MKLKPRFFDGTAFKKDITRFAPLWALYLIGGLMIALPSMGTTYYGESLAEVSNRLSDYIGYFGMINIAFAMLCAQLLHGDIFNSKLCNALHAMPLRRENWFVTHTVSGILFSLVPNTVLAISVMPFLQQYWYTALLWLLGMEMHFLFFFGLATFSMHCTGSRFASIVVYIILNFLSLLIAWFLHTMYQPMLYGFEFNDELFFRYCPVVWLSMEPDYFRIIHPDTCACQFGYRPELAEDFVHTTYWGSLGESWGYLSILTILGVVFLVLALLLYRARHLETAGDFVAFKAMRPVFWVLFSLCAGGAVQLIGVEMLGLGNEGGYIFLGLGLICGFFVAQMLLARSAKVFNKRSFLHLGLFLAAFVLSLVFTKIDLLGLTRYVPETNTVEKVFVTDYQLSDQDMKQLESDGKHYQYFLGQTAEQIDQVRELHEALYTEGDGSYRREYIYLTYVLNNGTVVRRAYSPESGSDACCQYWDMMAQRETLLQADSLEELTARVATVCIDGRGLPVGGNLDFHMEDLLAALWADGENGGLYDHYRYHITLHGEKESYEHTVELQYTDGSTCSLGIFSCCEGTLAWIQEFEQGFSNFFYDPEVLMANTVAVGHAEGDFKDPDTIYSIIQCLQTDLADGTAMVESSSGYIITYDDVIYLYLQDGHSESVYISSKSTTYQYIQELLETL